MLSLVNTSELHGTYNLVLTTWRVVSNAIQRHEQQSTHRLRQVQLQ